MATLAGVAIIDASGNPLTDGSGNYLRERDIPVGVSADGLLFDANSPAGGGSFLDTIRDVLDAVDNIWDTLQDLTSGALTMQAIRNLQDDFNAYLLSTGADFFSGHDPTTPQTNYSINGLLSEIDMAPTGGLTEEEHAKLMSLTNAEAAPTVEDIWAHNLVDWRMDNSVVSQEAQSMLQAINIAQHHLLGFNGVEVPDHPYFRYLCSDAYALQAKFAGWNDGTENLDVPTLDLTLIQSGDTVWTYLLREYSDYTWLQAGPGQWGIGGRIYIDDGSGTGFYVCTLTDADLRAQLPHVSPTVPPEWISSIEVTVPNLTVSPVWPGAENVTYGSAVGFTENVSIDEDMDGVVVAVTTPPTRTGKYLIGDAILDYGVGRIAFVDDSGHIEPWQYLGFRSALFTPKSMVRAAGVKLQVLGGAEGTVTPWLINEPGS